MFRVLFALKWVSYYLKITVIAKKLAHQMKHSFWSLLNFARIPTVRNSDKKNIYNIGNRPCPASFQIKARLSSSLKDILM